MTSPRECVYIAGPMRGYPDFNFPAFHQAATELRKLEYDVVNPAEIEPDKQTESWQYYMRRDIAILVQECQGVFALPGWERSEGARLEIQTALAIGLWVRRFDSGEPILQVPALESTKEEIAVNEKGGKQSKLPYRADLLPASAVLRVASVLREGAEKYAPNNWRLIESGSHLNHALVHLLQLLRGDTSEDHIGHFACRALMALEMHIAEKESTNAQAA